jgi:hypothetical protein
MNILNWFKRKLTVPKNIVITDPFVFAHNIDSNNSDGQTMKLMTDFMEHGGAEYTPEGKFIRWLDEGKAA